ncbi:Hypothetical protein D9617_44g038960 [Elsinoe fawcettii]|nr:Hypothetical protein D9617_44g038960 [Elsinoe fawcettii]
MGWNFAGQSTLGAALVTEKSSPWFGVRPVPRMVQNQLGHLLETTLIDLDKDVLQRVHQMLYARRRQDWVTATLSVFLLLHIREVDGGRNIYWLRYGDCCNFWIHPSTPTSLIQEQVASCNALLWHYHFSVGTQPLALNWNTSKAAQMVQKDARAITSMKALQAYRQLLYDNLLMGRTARQIYQDGDPTSVALSVSSLIFQSIESGSEVRDFC